MNLKTKNITARLIGAILLAAAIAGVFLYESKPRQEDSKLPIRPVKSTLIGKPDSMPKLYFPGTVDADSKVDLSFEVSGRLIEFPASRGAKVAQGDLLARIDPHDYENQVRDAQADLDLAQSSLDRIEKALKSQAVSQEDYSKALAERNKAEANLAIRKKALAETRLTASFDGIVADTYADNYDTIAAGKPVLKLMDTATLTITITLAQEYMMLAADSNTLEDAQITVEFDWLPQKSFPARLKNFATTADPVTRTYEATFYIEDTENLRLLPDLAGTVVVARPAGDNRDARLVAPSDAVAFDSAGKPFVWVLAKDGQNPDVYRASRRSIALGQRIGDEIEIVEGIEAETRIATAGVNIISEGQGARLLEQESDSEKGTSE